jgi:hypothetical protein
MKRTIIASILGIAGSVAMVATSQAQGTVYFQNYSSTGVNAPVTFATGGAQPTGGIGGAVSAGWGVGGEFTAALLYSVGNTGTYTLLTSANAGQIPGPAGYPAPFEYGSLADGPVTGPVGTSPGYFLGGGVTIPTYVSGVIAFELQAYNGSSYAASLGAGLWRGQSAPLVMASIATGTTPTGYLTGLTGFTVSTSIPEPTTLAFAGMGLLSLLAFARRKNV